MNYLGHLILLPDAGLSSLGNLLGDFFKGRVDAIAAVDLRIGVALHRQIDRFTDTHPAVLRSKARMSPLRQRVAGVLVDIFYDHFLAQDVALEPIRERLLPHAVHLPEPLREFPGRMISPHWLGSYRDISSIAHVLIRMEERRPRITGLAGAETELRQHYEALAEDLREFYPQAAIFTRDAFLRLQSASQAAAPGDEAAATASDPPQSA
ncbi:ACP phosphodiesterase [Bryobacter aggregatus]|uniref:acyl carrier protein phosphodiesterase n=1 Tax=Bryobacter aggregatus TaxID=360054 RepID=UPI0004E1CC86|nr:ACP phosphodiesterase [Bryobacter aggregatus]